MEFANKGDLAAVRTHGYVGYSHQKKKREKLWRRRTLGNDLGDGERGQAFTLKKHRSSRYQGVEHIPHE